MVRGKSMTSRRRRNQARPVGRALPGSAKRKAVEDVEGTGTERAARGRQAERLGGPPSPGWLRAQPGGESIERRNFFYCFPSQLFEKVRFEKINASKR